MKKVAILGLGVLGIEIAEKLKSEGYYVAGTTSSESKIISLKERFEEARVFNLSDKLELLKEFTRFDVLIITVPPSGSKKYSGQLIQLIAYFITANPALKIIYLSSISVYGSKNRKVTEKSSLDLQTENAKKMHEVENYLMSLQAEQIAVLRLGGLVGKNRHPVNYLKNKEKNKKPLAGVNLVHHEDVCEFILFSLSSFAPGIHNLCSIEHPPKKEYYNWEAKRRNLGEIDFDQHDKTLDKIVISKLETSANFRYKYCSPYDFPL